MKRLNYKKEKRNIDINTIIKSVNSTILGLVILVLLFKSFIPLDYKPYFFATKSGISFSLIVLWSPILFIFIYLIGNHIIVSRYKTYNEYNDTHHLEYNNNWIIFSAVFLILSIWFFFQLAAQQLVMTESSTISEPVFVLATPYNDSWYYADRIINLCLGIYFALNSIFSAYLFSKYCLKKTDDNS